MPSHATGAVERVRAAVRALAEEPRPPVLAVSGGMDSMVLLDACAAERRLGGAVVATFDHGTGAAARRAAVLVADTAARAGLPCVMGRPSGNVGGAGGAEAAWRQARWRFLREVAVAHGGAVATAHTADDQAETVFMRLLRGSGPRGLAGLLARSPVRRPLLGLTRAEVAAYAAARRLRWVEDPTNASRRHLRNRVRLDLLPALERVRPGFRRWLLDLGERAAALRGDVEGVVAGFDVRPAAGGGLSVAAAALHRYDAEALALLWPAVAALHGVTLDRRGTHRLAAFTTSGAGAGRVPLSGGAEVMRRRDRFVVRRRAAAATAEELPLEGEVRIGGWRFRPVSVLSADAWTSELPVECPVTVRAWRAGDRMRAAPHRPGRRVARFFADVGVCGMDRAGWPVVLAAGEIVWIPGVRRSDAAPVRSGRPLRYLCERDYSRSAP